MKYDLNLNLDEMNRFEPKIEPQVGVYTWRNMGHDLNLNKKGKLV